MEDKKSQFGFQPENYKILLIGLAINILGFLLMIGGAAKSPNEFWLFDTLCMLIELLLCGDSLNGLLKPLINKLKIFDSLFKTNN